MKILVTVVAGFIGNYVVDELIKREHNVYCTDYNHSKWVNDKAKYFPLDIENFTRVDALYNDIKPEVTIHLAGILGTSETWSHVHRTVDVNINGSINVYEACAKFKSGIITVDVGSRWLAPYTISKRAGAEYAFAYGNRYKIPVGVLRIFNVYGTGQSDEYAGVITKFIKNVKEGKPLKIFGDGMQTRDFISIYDVISIIANSLLKLENKRGEIYNIATGKTITISELANLILSLTGGKNKVEFVEPVEGDIRFSKPSIKNAENEMNFNPKIKLKNGLQKFIEEL